MRPVLSVLESSRWVGVYCFASGAFFVGEFKVGGNVLLCIRCFVTGEFKVSGDIPHGTIHI